MNDGKTSFSLVYFDFYLLIFTDVTLLKTKINLF